MLNSYTAFIWAMPKAREEATKALELFACHSAQLLVFQSDTVAVLADSRMAVHRLEGGSGVVLGDIFEGDHASAATSDHDSQSHAPAGIAMAALMKRCWGSYVAICRNQQNDVEVVRSPLGRLAVYHLHRDGLSVITSDVGALVSAGLLAVEIDWESTMLHLLAVNLRREATGLRGVAELLGGSRLTLSGRSRRIEALWSPWNFTSRDLEVRRYAEAVEMLRETVRTSVRAMCSRYRHLILGLSGGLDSSILACCLKGANAAVTALTLATRDRAGDEREYARTVADHAAIPLQERFEAIERVELNRSDAAHLPRPVARSFAQSGDRIGIQVAEAIGADGFIHGGGGDNVFCLMNSATPVADRILREGLSGGMLRTAMDISSVTECGLFPALKGGLGRAFQRRPAYRWPIDRTFLSSNAGPAGHPDLSHAWLDAPHGALPGKAMHIAWLLGVENHLEGFNREKAYPVLAPLLSQPIVELCLRIPTWLWYVDGQNRSVARRAFAGDLPASTVQRRTKGTPTSFAVEIFEANRGLIWALLSNGILSSQRLLDLDALDRTINAGAPIDAAACSRIMTLVDVEAWLRSWVGRSPNVGSEWVDRADAWA